ncbi:MAG: hypothetical protein NC117_06020 [Pseudoflavonifractor sp.]|nr:hypothetical protein [Pseudoflavonifractor sp.]
MDAELTPLESPAVVSSSRKTITIGIPSCRVAGATRFPLTPEGVEMLVSRGYTVKMEHDASAPIHYTDNNFARAGARVVERDEAFHCDVVIYLSPVERCDVSRMRRGALLLCWFGNGMLSRDSINALTERGITAAGINLMEEGNGHRPFADVVAEIDGRAAITLAASMMADRERHKGILMGGVAGVVPCEVTIIGSGISAQAAARSALGLGAIVRMFDNDVYNLRDASNILGPGVIASVLHPRVLDSALRTADIVVAGAGATRHAIGSDVVDILKRGVLLFDLGQDGASAFPSLPSVDVSSVMSCMPVGNTGRVCLHSPGSAVPRTVAMALSNLFVALFDDMVACDGIMDFVKMSAPMQRAVLTFMGKVVNRHAARIAGVRGVDISLFLSLS